MEGWTVGRLPLPRLHRLWVDESRERETNTEADRQTDRQNKANSQRLARGKLLVMNLSIELAIRNLGQ